MKATIINRDRARWRRYKTRHKLKEAPVWQAILDKRPTNRTQCQNSTRPCPWISCRYHLYLDITRANSIRINHPDIKPWELDPSCALDVADEGEHTLEKIGTIVNLTRERVRQIELAIFKRVRSSFKEY